MRALALAYRCPGIQAAQLRDAHILRIGFHRVFPQQIHTHIGNLFGGAELGGLGTGCGTTRIITRMVLSTAATPRPAIFSRLVIVRLSYPPYFHAYMTPKYTNPFLLLH